MHTCELCGQEGMSETEMRSHMRLVHVEGSPACPFCDLADLSHSEMVRWSQFRPMSLFTFYRRCT